jgi:hypothetical protein
MKRKYVALFIAATLGLALTGTAGVAQAISPTGTVVVQLTSPNGKTLAVGGTAITLSKGSSYVNHQSTNSSGIATFTAVPPSVKLTATLAATSTHIVVTKTGIEVGSNKSVTVKIHDPLGGSIAGTVFRPGGIGLATADVVALDTKGRVVSYTTADSSGNYTLAPLASGSYRVEFNTRLEGMDMDNESYGWSYWGGATSWTKAKTLKVHQQSATKSASVSAAINGSVVFGGALGAQVNFPSGFGNAKIVVEATHISDSFTDQLNSAGTGWDEFMNPGSYRLGIVGPKNAITGDTPTYWYTGDTTAPSTDASRAQVIHFTGLQNVTVEFIQNAAL